MTDNKGIFDLITLLFSMGGIVVAAYIGTRWLSRNISPQSGSQTVKIIDRVFISQDKSLMVIQVINRYMLISVSAGSIQKLCDIDPLEIEGLKSSPAEPGFAELFKSRLLQRLGTQGGGGQEEDQSGSSHQ